MMRAPLFVLLHYLAIGLLALLGYLYGRQLTRGVRYHSAAERVSISLGLGLGVISYLTFFLGVVGLLNRPVVLSALLAGALICFPTWSGWARGAAGAWRRLKSVVGANRWAAAGAALAGLVFCAPLLALPLYPPISFDATFYHLPLAKTYVENHAIVFTPHLRFQVFPMINEMWFTLALLLYDDVLAHLFQLLTLCVLAAAVYSFGRRHFSSRAGVWAAALLVASPMVLWSGSVAYIDISLMLFLTAAVYSFANWLQTSERRWLVLAGVFCGFAAGAKYTALIFLGLLGLVTLYRAFRERSLRAPLILSAAAAVVASPWYLRNYFYTRNPLFPFLPKLFGASVWWSAEDLQGVFHDLQEAHGIGRSLGSLVTLPWHLAFNQQVFFAEEAWSPVYFVALPLTIIWAVKNPRVGGLLALCLFYIVFWFFAGQILRYLLPVLPFLCLATAATLDGLLLRLAPRKGWANSKGLVVAAALALAFPGWRYAVRHWRDHGPFPVTRSQRDRYLALHLPSYPVYQALNRQKGRGVRLYAFHDENMVYFLDGVALGDWFGPLRYARILGKMTDGGSLYNELKSLGVNYFLVNAGRFHVPLPEDQFFQDNFEPLYARGSVTLFKLSDEPVGDRPARQLLQNPGFEQLEQSRPILWGRAGEPLVDDSGQNSSAGKVAVRCKGAENIFYQSVPAKPGATYVLSYMARAAERGQRARLQVNWSDGRAKFLSTDIELCEAGAEWRRCAMTVKAPPDAAHVVVFTSCHEQSEVWLDNYSLTEAEGAAGPPGEN